MTRASSRARPQSGTHVLRIPRSVRDANVAGCHLVFDLDAQQELYGKLLLGIEMPAAIV